MGTPARSACSRTARASGESRSAGDERHDARVPPGGAQEPRRHVAVAAVVPAAAHDHEPAARRRERDGRVRDGAPRPVHQRERRGPEVLDRGAIDLPHLRGADEPHGAASLQDDDRRRDPRVVRQGEERARRAEPRRRVRGDAAEREGRAPPAPRTTSTSCQPIPAGAPSAFDAASFAANRAA